MALWKALTGKSLTLEPEDGFGFYEDGRYVVELM